MLSSGVSGAGHRFLRKYRCTSPIVSLVTFHSVPTLLKKGRGKYKPQLCGSIQNELRKFFLTNSDRCT